MINRIDELDELTKLSEITDKDIEKGQELSFYNIENSNYTHSSNFGNTHLKTIDDCYVASESVAQRLEYKNSKIIRQRELMSVFFDNVEFIKNNIDSISNAVRHIENMNDSMLRVTNEAEENEINNKVKNIIAQTNIKAKKTKNLLDHMKNDNDARTDSTELLNSDKRIRKNMHNTLTRKFVDEMKVYQKSQQHYKNDIRKKAERTILSVKPDATTDEIDHIMKSGEGREALIKQAVLVGGVADPIKQAYRNVASKHEDVVRLEQSVTEIHQMFLDFALLTEKQGELLDQIEFNVKAAVDYVEDANVDMHSSIKHQKSVRRKQCWIIIFVLLLIIIIFFSTVGGTLFN